MCISQACRRSQSAATDSAPFSEILFWVFAHRLWDAVHREVLRGYVTIEDRLDVLKGRWLVAAQVARPDGWRRDWFDVAYDEFTEDNLPNRLFKATVHRLSRWSQWTDTRLRGRSHFGAAEDRSIALLDVALRRRFTFVELMPQPELLGDVAGVPLGKMLTALNRKLEAYLDRDHQIGHSYLMNLATIADLRFAWEHKVMPLLQEYFYGDGEKLLSVIGKEFVQLIPPTDDSDQRTVYRLKKFAADAEFVNALKVLANQ